MKLLLLLVAVAFADPIFLDAPAPRNTQDLLPQTAPNDEFVTRERYAKMDLKKLYGFGSLEFNLFEDVTFEVVNSNVEKNRHGFVLWEGRVEGAEWSTVTLTFDDTMMMGHIQADARVFEIRPVESGVKIIEIAQSLFPNESEPASVEEETEDTEGDGYVWPNTPRPDYGNELLQNSVIDILHLEPAGTQAGCNNINLGAIESQYQNHMNSVWGSQYGIQSRVMARCFIRNTTNNFSTELNNLRNSNAVAQARNDLRADLVALIIQASGSCGIAYRPNIPISNANQNTAFSVDARSCAIPNWTYAHEFGHNFGLNHDRHMTGGGASQCNFGGFNNWNSPTTRSIMSYNNRCSQVFGRNCQRLGTYSNAGSLGRTCGGTSTGEDCRRDLLRSAPVIANYR